MLLTQDFQLLWKSASQVNHSPWDWAEALLLLLLLPPSWNPHIRTARKTWAPKHMVHLHISYRESQYLLCICSRGGWEKWNTVFFFVKYTSDIQWPLLLCYPITKLYAHRKCEWAMQNFLTLSQGKLGWHLYVSWANIIRRTSCSKFPLLSPQATPSLTFFTFFVSPRLSFCVPFPPHIPLVPWSSPDPRHSPLLKRSNLGLFPLLHLQWHSLTPQFNDHLQDVNIRNDTERQWSSTETPYYHRSSSSIWGAFMRSYNTIFKNVNFL